jgi:hypothetical protein
MPPGRSLQCLPRCQLCKMQSDMHGVLLREFGTLSSKRTTTASNHTSHTATEAILLWTLVMLEMLDSGYWMLTSHSCARTWGTVAAEVVAVTTFLADRISQMLDSGFWMLTSCMCNASASSHTACTASDHHNLKHWWKHPPLVLLSPKR